MLSQSAKEHKDELWGEFDLARTELVKAQRRVREGDGQAKLDVLRHRAMLMAIGCDLAEMGEKPDLSWGDGE